MNLRDVMGKRTEIEKELIEQCRFYKGEDANPFDWDTQNTANQFWEYEKSFCHKYLMGIHSCMSPKDAMALFLGELFTHLADMYDSMDHGESFRKKYYGTEI